MSVGIYDNESNNDYQFDTYADAVVDTTPYLTGDIIVVNNSTGIWPFNNPAGDYYWNGSSLEYATQSLKERIKSNQDQIDLLNADSHTHPNKSVLDQITQTLLNAWDSASVWVVANGSQVLSDIQTLFNDKLDKGAYPGNAQDLDDDNKGTVDIHNDVDLFQGVVPLDGWVPKFVNGQIILCMKEQAFYRGNPIVNTNANNPSGNQNLEFTFNLQRVGHYKFTIKHNHSVDSTGVDLIIRPLINSQTVTTRVNGETHRLEAKDSVGNDGDGRGTDQKAQAGNTYYYNNTTIGNKTLRLDCYSNGAGVEAAIWDIFIEVEEIFNPQITN